MMDASEKKQEFSAIAFLGENVLTVPALYFSFASNLYGEIS